MTWRWAKNQWERKKKKKREHNRSITPAAFFVFLISLSSTSNFATGCACCSNHPQRSRHATHTYTYERFLCVCDVVPALSPPVCVCVCHLKKKKSPLHHDLFVVGRSSTENILHQQQLYSSLFCFFVYLFFFSLTFPPSAFIPQQQKYPREKN